MDERKQWLTEDSFSRQEELVFVDCDARRRARLAALLSLMAATAGNDYTARGLTYEKMSAMRQVFLLSRIALRVHRHPEADECLTVTTWENGIKGVHLQRNYEMTDRTGELCISGKSEWILVNPETRKILRPDTFAGKKFTRCPKEIDCPDCKKVTLPREGLDFLGNRTVVYSDLDGNGHVYSGKYGDIFWDYLPRELQRADWKEFYINYSREAVQGEELSLYGFREGGSYRIEGLARGEHCFTGECVFETE